MAYQPDRNLADFIQRLPKTETHLHLEGALPYHLLQQHNPDRYAEPPDSWRDDYKFRNFDQFESELIGMAVEWHTSPERYHEAAQVIFKNHLKQNVKYVEASFHAGIIEFLKIPGPEIIAAVRAAVPDGLEVRIFMGMLRNQRNEIMAPVIDECLGWEGLDGIDLHGVELLPLEDWAKALWAEARQSGKFTKAHAGEFGGAAAVMEVIEHLGVTRVQHGVRVVEDPAVLQQMRDYDVTLDICPISNVKLNVFESMKDHSIRPLFDEGVRCTINTDDPLSFGNSLNEEYAALAIDLNFSEKELARIARNGFEVALMPDEQKQPYLSELDAIISER